MNSRTGPLIGRIIGNGPSHGQAESVEDLAWLKVQARTISLQFDTTRTSMVF